MNLPGKINLENKNEMSNTMTALKYGPALLSLSHDVSHPWRQKGHIFCTFQCYKFSIKAQMSFLALRKNC